MQVFNPKELKASLSRCLGTDLVFAALMNIEGTIIAKAGNHEAAQNQAAMVSNLVAEYKDFGNSVFVTPDVEQIVIEVDKFTIIAHCFCNLILYVSCSTDSNMGMNKSKVKALKEILEEKLGGIGIKEAAHIKSPEEGAEEN